MYDSYAQARRLRALSAETRESVASLIRRAVDQFLLSGNPDRSALYRQSEAVVGKYRADRTDVSLAHDRYLDEDFSS